MTRLLLGVGLTAIVGVLPINVGLGQARTSVADSIRLLEHARAHALLTRDTAALGRMIAPEFTEVARRGTIRTREDNLRDLATDVLRYTSIAFDSLDVRVYGDVAIVRGIATSNRVLNDKPEAWRVRYMRVFVRRNGRWQAVAAQSTPIQ
jgi:ketosteroid isomerase-like protein